MIWYMWAKLTALARWTAVHLTPWRYPNTQQAALRIEEIIHHMNEGSWAGLKHEFTLPVRVFIPESLLEKGWKSLCTAFGPFQNIGTPIITRGWLLTTVKVPLRFQRAEFGMLLLMTLAGGLLGIQFLSLQTLGLGGGWQIPSYADGSARESEMALGKGKYKVGATLCLPSATAEEAETQAQTQTRRFPCVVLLPGSGPCDRDSTVHENKPFKDLALGLACHGIASIRFDKVTHTHRKAFRNRRDVTLTDEYVDYAVDAVLKGQKHPDILPNRIFVLGHSLGAVVAPTIAGMDEVAGCIIMAGPAEPIYRCLVRQLRYIISLDGPESLYLGRQIDEARKQAELADSDNLTLSTPAKKLPFGLGPSYWLDYRKFDPIGTASRLGKPIAVLQGGRDYQVTVKDDYGQWHEALRERHNVEFYLYKQLNHLFVGGDGPSTPLEYSVPGHVDEQVLKDLASWVFNTD